MTKNITDKIISIAIELQAEEYPKEIISFTKYCLLDYLGNAIAGVSELKDKLNRYLTFDNRCGNSAIIGLNIKRSPESAALLNGISSHYLELDDGSRFGMVHLGSPIFSTLLAIASEFDVNGCDIIRGAIVGYEVANRLACLIQPEHKKHLGIGSNGEKAHYEHKNQQFLH